MDGTIYLICLDEPIGGEGRNSARHYVGWTNGESVDSRLERHRNGTGAAMLAYAAENGVTFDVVRTWLGTRDDERRMKTRGHHAERCPRCAAAERDRNNARRRRRYRRDKVVADLLDAWRDLPVARAMVSTGERR